jgi:hypothetical protein
MSPKKELLSIAIKAPLENNMLRSLVSYYSKEFFSLKGKCR